MFPILFIEEVLEYVFFLIITGQTITCTNPYASLTVCFYNTGDVVGDTVRVILIMLINRKCISVVFVNSVISGKPHIAPFILIDGKHRTL